MGNCSTCTCNEKDEIKAYEVSVNHNQSRKEQIANNGQSKKPSTNNKSVLSHTNSIRQSQELWEMKFSNKTFII